MVTRRPLVVLGGVASELPADDTLPITVQTARIHKGVRQPLSTDSPATFPAGGGGQITFGSVTFRQGSAVSTSTANALTVVATGVYQVAVELWLVGGGTGERSASVRVNSTAIREYGSTAAGRLSGSGTMLLNAGDVVTVTLYVAVSSVYCDGQSAKDSGLTLTYLGPAAPST